MNDHQSTETLNELVEGTLDQIKRREVEGHLEACSECSRKKEAIRKAMLSVASLPEVAPSPDDSRAIRLAVLEWSKRPAWWALPRVWAIAGSTALAAVALVGFAALRPDKPAIRSASPASDLATRILVFETDEQVTEAVRSDPQVRVAGRYTVADVAEKQEELALQPTPFAAKSLEDSGAARKQSASSSSTIGACLRQWLRSEPVPKIALVSREAIYKGREAYLLVYATAPSASDENAPLSTIQVILTDRVSCFPILVQRFRI